MEKKINGYTRWFDLPSLLMQLGLITTITIRLAATNWTDYLDRLENLILYAFLLGLWVGYARFHRALFIPIGIIYGLIASFWVMGQVYTPDMVWPEKFPLLVNRLWISLSQLMQSQKVTDPILFYFPSCILIWLVMFLSAYSLVRDGSVWFSLASAGTLLLVVDRYDLNAEHRVMYYFIFMLLALLLLTRNNLVHQRRRWLELDSLRGTGTLEDITRVAFLTIVGLLTVVWVIPALAAPSGPLVRLWRDMTQPMEGMRSQASNAFAPLQGDSNGAQLFSSNYLALGDRVDQATTPVFQVSPNISNPRDYHYYWRAHSYDTYLNGNWTNSGESTLPFTGQVEESTRFDWNKRTTVQFSLIVQSDSLGTLYTEHAPGSISINTRVFGLSLPDGMFDINRLEPEELLLKGAIYEFTSSMSDVTIQDLEQSGGEYPGWVRGAYLQIPQGYSQRVMDLAGQITATALSPYEKTVAITRYLRERILYKPKIQPTPANRDPIEYFLFSSREGFCTYYASAEVLLLRAAGIPARLVVGFAQGEYDEGSKSYLVRMKNMHAWPEVYFQEYGWVVFEPTVIYESVLLPDLVDLAREERAQEELDRRQRRQDEDITTGASTQSELENNLQGDRLKSIPLAGLWIFLFIIIIMASAIMMFRSHLQRQSLLLPVWLEKSITKTGLSVPEWIHAWADYARSSEIEQYYRQVMTTFRLLGCIPDQTDTPRERHMKWIQTYPPIRLESEQLLADYEKSRFSQDSVNSSNTKKVSRSMIKQIIQAYIRHILHKTES